MMAWLVKQINKKNKGFTLIEMVVVMAIIAVLIAIAVPQVLRLINKSKVSADLASAKLIATAVQQYMADGKDPNLTSPTTISSSGTTDLEKYINAQINNGIPTPKFNSSWSFWVQASATNETILVGVSTGSGTGTTSTTYYILYPQVGIISRDSPAYDETSNLNNPYYKFK